MNGNRASLWGMAFSGLMAVAAPFIFSSLSSENLSTLNFPGWPHEYEGKPLVQLSLTEKERVFVKGFPGKIGRFSDGNRELIIRWVEQPTRRLHPAADCFKGIGFYIHPQPIKMNKRGIKMGCFNATKEGSKLKVCEFIAAGNGDNWSDISAWYWAAVFTQTSEGWMSYVIAEKG